MVGGRIPVNIGAVSEVRICELLGTGGFGSAWRVSDAASGTEYMLKVIQGIRPGSVLAERVRLEASVRIPSEYIVPVHGLCEWDPSTFMILFDYVKAVSLDKLLEAHRLTDEQKRGIFVQTLQGVADAHRSNIIHRDLKPANILVCPDGRVKIIDFGISKFKDKGLTLSGEFFGTPLYMAPELVLLGAYCADARADIYSLGHILYELTTGRHFWFEQGWRSLEDFARYLAQVPPPREAIDLDGFHCGFLPGADALLPGMVKVLADERTSTVDEMLSAIGVSPYLPPMPSDLNLRRPLLIVESGTNTGARTLVSLEDGECCTLGRTDFAGADKTISRQHLTMLRRGEQYYVQDVSRNGTLVAGVALEKDGPYVAIKHGDRVKVGDIFLRFAFLKDE